VSAPMPLPTRRLSRLLAAAATTSLVLAAAGPALASAPATRAPSAAKAGLAGAPIVLATHVALDEGSADIATDASGTAYVGWISSPVSQTTERQVHLCVLPLGAQACEGGVQTIDALDDSSAADLKVLIVHGVVTLIWFHDTVASETGTHGSEIAEATVGAGDVLSAGTDVATAPSFGSMLDAEIGPGGDVWTIAYGASLPHKIEVREGISNDPVVVKTPYSVGFAHIAFSHGTPIIAITEDGRITQPAAYSYRPGSSFTAFKNVKGTWTVGTDIGLVSTSSGVRLVTAVGNANYYPVVAKWNGHGFSKRTLTGDHKSPGPSTHDDVTDASGRLADVSDVNGSITVANLVDTTHAAIFRFPAHGTTTPPAPQIATTPRGHGWVLWAVEEGASTTLGDKLSIVPVLLSDLDVSRTKHGAAGSVTVTGPASCLPAISIGVGVAAQPKHGWHVSSRHLSLGSKTLHSTLNGASLTPGKRYTLKGRATFAGGGSPETVKVTLSFRACPKP